MEYAIKLDGVVTGFSVGKQYIDCICGKDPIGQKRNAHKKMFDCIGRYKDCILTVSYPCNELSFWDKDTLNLVQTVNVPLSLSGNAVIKDDLLYISSRNMSGIGCITLLNYKEYNHII